MGEKKRVLFPWGFTGEETENQLAGIYCINKRVEGTLILLVLRTAYKMVQFGNKGFDLESNFNKTLLLIFSPKYVEDD